MGFFGNDTLVAASGSTTETTTPTSAGTNCTAPPFGKPHYDPDVLLVMYGEGKFTLTNYNRVKAGTLSIEDLDLTAADLARLRCQDEVTGAASSYDAHHDPLLPPTITDVVSGVTVIFESGHHPTDKAHRIRISSANPLSLAAGAVIAKIHFSDLYEDDGGYVSPIVQISNEMASGPEFRAVNTTYGWYELVCVSGISFPALQVVSAVTTPTRR